MQQGKKNDLSPRSVAVIAVAVAALVGLSFLVGPPRQPSTVTPTDAGASGDAAPVAVEPPASGCALFAEHNDNNGARDREGFVMSLNLERRPPALGRWAVVEPRTLVMQGLAACDRAAILAFLPQSMPSAMRAACTSFGFRTLRCEPSAGAARTIDLTEACPCSDESDPASCRCEF